MRITINLCVLLLMSCASCTSSNSFKPGVHEFAYDSKYNSEQKGLKFDSAGIFLLSPQNQDIIIGYNVTHPLEITEARKVMVNLVEEALEQINENDIAAPYLNQLPYPLQCLSLRILLKGEHPPGVLSYVLLLGGDIVYFKNTDESSVKDLFLRESFAEAYEKVREIPLS